MGKVNKRLGILETGFHFDLAPSIYPFYYSSIASCIAGCISFLVTPSIESTLALRPSQGCLTHLLAINAMSPCSIATSKDYLRFQFTRDHRPAANKNIVP
jgi:hypothetical protein